VNTSPSLPSEVAVAPRQEKRVLKGVAIIQAKISSIVEYYQPSVAADFYVITYCYFEDEKLLHSKFVGL